ncbi:efflux protein, mate family [Halogeometricum borinquense DSM 11551]|uniref:Multidrug-efflux transporter n=1 Tax=Halogeometricum borinquense (strain ATCC 700274 / DSM 11551 / JCM 10706 / KCTC 4070 / PR3) TaxID=469382 RepID=E4NST0_HALBP|nr:MATE family efflux transporter [Halogeometricum borinquense]ADQ65818.1 putative efflux protein, MATE family [Halogeometricum borinquense DSM 11551]ELY26820.1 efflux protein, mate family [Halogeometricum borinquense DSM 11551]
MAPSLQRRAHDALMQFPALLARLGLVDREKGSRAFDLAVPVMVTGGMRTLLRIADFLMVSIALGNAAVAGLELGFQYYFIPFGLALALTSGTISVVSRFVGANDYDAADFAVKQSLWLALLISVPISIAGWMYARPLIALLTNDLQTIKLGSAYLRIVMLSVAFRFWSMIAARALAGVGDTRTPMYVRLLTLPTNIILNAVLIFGLFGAPALGVEGAAWGTVAANTLAAVIFFVLLASGRWDVRLRFGGKQWDWDVVSEIVRVGLPLAGTRLSRTFGRFPFLFVLGLLGTNVVAAYAIGRRVMLLALMPAWGYSTAASTLVGQAIGGGDDGEATEYGWQTLRIALVTQLLIAAAIFVAATPIAQVFGASDIPLTARFIRVFGLGVAGFSVSRTMRGALRGAGDTRWPLYGGLVGTYLVRLPIAFLAPGAGFTIAVLGITISPGLDWGLWAVYAAILADMYVRGVINVARYYSGKWIHVAHESNVGSAAD